MVMLRFNYLIILFLIFGFICINSICGFSKLNPIDFRNDNISVLSDYLLINGSSNDIHFTGNVRLSSGDFIVEADELKITSDEETFSKSFSIQTMHELIAEGKVRIEFDGNVALTERAIYLNNEGVMVLAGPSTLLNYGGSIIKGKKIIYYIYEEQFVIEDGITGKIDTDVFIIPTENN